MPFLVAAVVLAGPSSPSVETLGAAVARLGAALGRPVAAARALVGIPVLVDAPELGADATLSALAAATRSTLVRDGKTLRLERTDADRAALVAAHRAVLRARVVAGLAAWDEAIARAEPLGDPAAQVRAARARQAAALRAQGEAREAGGGFTPPFGLVFPDLLTPAARLLRATMGRLGPDRLAALGPGEARFLSNRPNAVESPLPNFADLVDAYLKAQARYAAAMGQPAPEGRPAKAILTLDEGGANLGLYDSAGHRSDGVGMRYGGTGVFYVPPPGPPASAVPRRAPLDDATRRLRALTRPPNGTVAWLRATDLPETFLHPERSDPLDFEVRTALLAQPRLPGTKGVVAALSDDLLEPAAACAEDGELDATAFAWRLVHGPRYERTARDGVELVRSEDALASEAGIVDRKALGRGIRQIVADGGATLGDWSALQLALFTGRYQSVTSRYLSLFGRFGHSNVEGPNLQTGGWAILGAAFQAATPVADGGAPPFDRLLSDGVVKGWLRFAGPPGTSDLELAPSSLLASLRAARLGLHRTETLVAKVYGGFDANGPIRLGFEKADVALAQERFSDALEPEPLGADLALPGRRFLLSKLAPPVNDRDRRDAERRIQGLRYLLGRRVQLEVEIVLGGLRARVLARDWDVGHQGTAFADLPPAFREAVLRGAARALDEPPPGRLGGG